MELKHETDVLVAKVAELFLREAAHVDAIDVDGALVGLV